MKLKPKKKRLSQNPSQIHQGANMAKVNKLQGLWGACDHYH
jgi:hypothetical protein